MCGLTYFCHVFGEKPNSPLSLAGQDPWEGGSCPECQYKRDNAKSTNHSSSWALGYFLLLLSSSIFISRNFFSKEDCPLFLQEAHCCAWRTGLKCQTHDCPLPHPIRSFSTSVPFGREETEATTGTRIGLDFCPEISNLMLIFSEFSCQAISQALVIPHT